MPELRKQKAAKDLIVSPHDVIAAAPDVIVASWCGKKVALDKIRQRSGWNAIPAVRNYRIVEIKSALILQPGLRLTASTQSSPRWDVGMIGELALYLLQCRTVKICRQ